MKPLSVYAGIDPGLTSAALAIQNAAGEFLYVSNIPFFQVSKKTKAIDCRTVKQILLKHGVTHVGIEDVGVRAGQGLSSSAAFMKATGTLYGLCVGMDLNVEWITPRQWQVPFGLFGQGRTYADKKEASRQFALMRFPQLAHDLRYKNRSDMAEAALICEHARLRVFPVVVTAERGRLVDA